MSRFSQVSHIRRNIEERMEMGASIDAFVDSILVQAPNTLIELILSDFLRFPLFRQKITQSSSELEKHLSAKELHLQLAQYAQEDGVEILHTAMNRHVEQLWLIDLSKLIEGDMMGYQHLMRKRKDRNFPAWCFRYALHGSRDGIIQMAAETGNPIPAAALLRAGDIDKATTAGARALEQNPNCAVFEYMLATSGPDIEDIVRRIIEKFQGDTLPVKLDTLCEYYNIDIDR